MIHWGIILEPIAPYSPLQNGIAEHFSLMLLDLACTILFNSKLPKWLWDKAVSHVVYLRNCMWSQAVDGKTSYKMWNGKKLNVEFLCLFGCDIWILNKNAATKLNARA